MSANPKNTKQQHCTDSLHITATETFDHLQKLQRNGHFAPPIERTHGEYILHFNIKLRRNNSLGAIKQKLFEELSRYERYLIIDVDPV